MHLEIKTHIFLFEFFLLHFHVAHISNFFKFSNPIDSSTIECYNIAVVSITAYLLYRIGGVHYGKHNRNAERYFGGMCS